MPGAAELHKCVHNNGCQLEAMAAYRLLAVDLRVKETLTSRGGDMLLALHFYLELVSLRGEESRM